MKLVAVTEIFLAVGVICNAIGGIYNTRSIRRLMKERGRR